jgi:glycosyltransferase involved in cell wall biosynthesis
MLTGNEKWGAFSSATFFVLPSHQENFGIAVAEAMALGLPVLITKKVNIWREVEASGAGHVVGDDLADITEGLQLMLSRSQAEIRIMGDKARLCFMERFNLEKNARELLSLMAGLGQSRQGAELEDGKALIS